MRGNSTKKDTIADAVLLLSSRDGLDKVSLRSVAREAGISMGQVQYHFATTADMLLHAIERTMQAMEARIAARLIDRPPTDAMAPLRSIAQEFLGDDPETRALIRVAAQYKTWTMRDPRITGALTRNDANLERDSAAIFLAAKRRGLLHSRLDAAMEAKVYWALLRGLAADVAFGLTSSADALETMRYYMSSLAR